MTLGQFLRDRRIEASLTQEQLEERSGYSQGQISTWERDREIPRLIHLARLAQLLGFDVGDAARLVTVEEQDEPTAQSA